jgi:hypothetical protein
MEVNTTSPIENAKCLNNVIVDSIQFSVCTLVTRKEEYKEMLRSFVDKGFTIDDCEFLYIDNSESCVFDAYEGYNQFLQKAKGEYIILCHQDILLHDNDKNDLLNLINEVSSKDSNWGILANAGGINLKWIATHITEGKTGVIRIEKYLPLKVKTVDENFMVVKKSANLALSNDLKGFHFYGTDICLIADLLGFNSYVIGFNLIHKSNGNTDKNFFQLKKALQKKYKRAYRSRYLTTTFSRMYFGGERSLQFYILNSGPILFLVRQYYKFFTSKKQYKL